MGGFHVLDILVIAGIALLIFGPKTLQSLSHSAGKGVSQAKEMKNKLMAELPVEELSKMNETFSRIPTSPQQVAHRLVANALKTDEPAEEAGELSEVATDKPSTAPALE